MSDRQYSDARVQRSPLPLENPAERDRLAALVARNGRSLRDREAFDNDILAISYWLEAGLAERDPELLERRRRNLKKVATSLAKVENALDDLDDEGMQLLRIRTELRGRIGQATPDSFLWSRLFPDEQRPDGRARFALFRGLMADFGDWVAEAAVLSAPSKRGPHRSAERGAVQSLCQLWVDQTGVRPTMVTRDGVKQPNDLTEFCEAVVNPIIERHPPTRQDGQPGSPPGIVSMVDNWVYRRR